MKLFKNYEEYLTTLITMIRDFSEESHKRIRLAINVCSSLHDDREKIYRLNTSFKECLWEKDEAIIMGFHQYIEKEYKKTRGILEYHDENCEGHSNCVICNDRNKTIKRLRNKDERKESRICSE